MAKVRINSGEYGPGKRLEVQENILENTPIIPEPIEYSDIDKAFFSFFNDNVTLVDDNGNKVPTFTLYSNQRFSEYSQTWKHVDNDGNLLMNFKTVNRENNPNFGTIQGGHYSIPGNNRFTVRMREVVDKNGIECYEITSMSQPLQIDLNYRFNFITSKYERLNKFNVEVNRLFSSKQCYLEVKGHYMPMTVDSISDETTYSIEDRKFFIQSVAVKVLAYIIPDGDIKVELKPKRAKLNTNLDRFERAQVSMDYEDDINFKLDIEFVKNVNKVSFVSEDNMVVWIVYKENAKKITMRVNDDDVDPNGHVKIYNGDEVQVRIVQPNSTKNSVILFKGVLQPL